MGNSVFVIGAGASVDFGLPTGYQLIDLISDLCGEIQKIYTSGKDDPDITDQDGLKYFAQEIFHRLAEPGSPDSMLYTPTLSGILTKIRSGIWLADSIDNYVNQQDDTNIKEVAKILISTIILASEKRSLLPKEIREKAREENKPTSLYLPEDSRNPRLDFSNYRNTWLVPFFRALRSTDSFEELESRLSRTTMIIFNYDRCVEHFLFHAFKLYDGLSVPEVADLLSKIKFIHPYGKLGHLQWQSGIGDETLISFGELNDITDAQKAALSIKTFADAKSPDGKLLIQKKIRDAEKLIFLGFGFHKQNMVLLGSESETIWSSSDYRHVYATGFGLSENLTKIATERLLSFACKPGFRHHRDISGKYVNINNGNCAELFNEFGELLF